jgi:hypothetical protein
MHAGSGRNRRSGLRLLAAGISDGEPHDNVTCVRVTDGGARHVGERSVVRQRSAQRCPTAHSRSKAPRPATTTSLPEERIRRQHPARLRRQRRCAVKSLFPENNSLPIFFVAWHQSRPVTPKTLISTCATNYFPPSLSGISGKYTFFTNCDRSISIVINERI